MASDPFRKHGISHLSASSLALYRNEPALWCCRYLFGAKDDAGPRAWLGSAVEAGVDWALFNPKEADGALAKARQRFELDAQGDLSDDVEKARSEIAPILENALAEIAPLGRPSARQFRVEHWIDGIEIPVVGYLDWIWPDLIVDLKTTSAMPSEPRPDHVAQMGSYWAVKKRPVRLVYVTPKKRWSRDLTEDELQQGLKTFTRTAHALRRLLSVANSKDDVASFFVPRPDYYQWSDATRAVAAGIWQ